jgi:hypothetical protein
MASMLGLGSTLRPRGRSRNEKISSLCPLWFQNHCLKHKKSLARPVKLFAGHGIINSMSRVNGDLSLFEVPAKVPDGFIYHQNFLLEGEEHELIREIQKLHLTPFKYYQFSGKRRTASFGWQYEFGTSEITTAPDAPAFSFTGSDTRRKTLQH